MSMTTDVDSSSSENRFPGKISRKSFLVLLPAILIPIIIVVIDITLLSKFSRSGRIVGTLSVSVVLGLMIAFIVSRYIKKQIIQPIEDVTDTTRRFALGDLKDRTRIERNDEIGLLAYYVDQMGNFLLTRFQSLEVEVNSRNHQIRIMTELSQITASAPDLEQLLQRSVNLIAERFNHTQAAIYLINKAYDRAVLKAVSGTAGSNQDREEDTIPLTTDSHFGWVAKNNLPMVFPSQEMAHLSSPDTILARTKSAAVIPISSGDVVMGFIHVQDRNVDRFSHDEITTLQTIANQIAVYTQHHRRFGSLSSSPDAAPFLYQASHTIITANTAGQVFAAIKNTLKQMPYAAALFVAEQNLFSALYVTDPSGHELADNDISEISVSRFPTAEFTQKPYPISITKPEELERLPDSIVSICRVLRYNSLMLYPLVVNGELTGLLFLGATQAGQFTSTTLDTISRLVDISATSLEKINALQTITDHLNELKTLNTISQSISTETNLDTLYAVIHQQIIQVMGSVNFLIALYAESSGTIEIPYMDDGDEILSVPPFPLGQGLTSIIIRTRQPLMIVEDTVNRGRALGAIVTSDKPALSWLGVPMILGGGIIGAIVVQDLEQEHRFDENDMRLLTTMAAQVAIAIRNTRLVESARERSERDRQLYEITNKIRRAVDIQGVIATTAQELGQALSARSAHIEISLEPISKAINGDGSHNRKDVSE
jgi:GAF domain-containing protein/HAMP domain-containing protein